MKHTGFSVKEELVRLLCKRSVNFADEQIYKLVSGRISRFYVNCKETVLHWRGAFLVNRMMLDAIGDIDVVAIGGLETGAIPIAEGVALLSGIEGQGINAFWIRKVRKAHGIVKWIEGPVKKGDKVVIIDDVATTGGSTIKAIERAREEGLEVVKVVILVDREEGGLDNIRKYVDDVVAIVTRAELMEEWKRSGRSDKTKSA